MQTFAEHEYLSKVDTFGSLKNEAYHVNIAKGNLQAEFGDFGCQKRGKETEGRILQ